MASEQADRDRLNARFEIKKKLVEAFGPIGLPGRSALALIRSADDQTYPHRELNGEKATWRLYKFIDHLPPDCISVVISRFYGSFDKQTGEWDADGTVDLDDGSGASEVRVEARKFFDGLPKDRRAFIELIGVLHCDKILAIDPVGDSFFKNAPLNKLIHVYADFEGRRDPFWRVTVRCILEEHANHRSPKYFEICKEQRVQIFPTRVTFEANWS